MASNHPPSNAYKQCLQALLVSVLKADARTYERTNEELLTLSSYLTLGNARTRVSRFSAFRGSAAAARGLGAIR